MKCMRLMWLLLLLVLREEARGGKRRSLYHHPDMKLTMPALVARHGYPVETHNVTSSDGYIQTLHRIPRGKSGDDITRIPVLVHHALLCSSVDWIILGPDKALGYKLADAGYDVWLANARGNTYSRGHVSKTIKDPEYWEFRYDITAYRSDEDALFSQVPEWITCVTVPSSMYCSQLEKIVQNLRAKYVYTPFACNSEFNLLIYM